MATGNEIRTKEDFNENSNDSDDGGGYTAHESPVVKIFLGFPNVSGETIKLIRESGIMHQDLSALTEEDLEMFGVNDAAIRAEMLSIFSNSPNQLLNFKKYCEEMDVDRYQETVHQNVLRELRQIELVLNASQMTLKSCPVSHDKLVTDDVYVSSLNMKALKEMLKVISSMSQKKSKKRSVWTFAVVGTAVLASIVILHKIVKNRL